jgi:hypothetical protein
MFSLLDQNLSTNFGMKMPLKYIVETENDAKRISKLDNVVENV